MGDNWSLNILICLALSTMFYQGLVSIYNVNCLLEGNALAQKQNSITCRGKLFQSSYQTLCCRRIISTFQILAFSVTKLKKYLYRFFFYRFFDWQLNSPENSRKFIWCKLCMLFERALSLLKTITLVPSSFEILKISDYSRNR